MTQRNRRFFFLFTIFFTVVAFASTKMLGQSTNTGTVVGVVTDQSGAAIPGAVITLTDLATNDVHTEKTTKTGQYIVVNLPPGDYKISATKEGFSVAEVSSQTVSVGSQSNANFKLAIGAVNETVEVTESNADLQTLNATVGTTVGAAQIENMPALGRDVSTFLTMQPGVSPEGSVAGTVVDQASFQLDGGNNSSDMDGSMTVYTGSFAGDPTGGISGSSSSGVMPTPVDSVEEFKSNTANQSADFNNSSGAQVQIVTKRGTDKWHATAYYYYLDNNLNANNWENNNTATANPSYHYTRYGYAGGGPILPKPILGGKTYFFANYEAFRFPNSEIYERTVPSANMRLGILNFPDDPNTYNLNLIDPRHLGLNPVMAQLWNTFEPLGNDTSASKCGGLAGSACDGLNQVGFKGSLSLPEKSDFAVARIDHDFGSKWHFMASYRYFRLTKTTDSQVDIGGGIAGDKLGVPVALSSRPQQPWYLVGQLTTTITSRLSSDFHYNYLRNLWSWNDAGAPPQIAGLGGALEPGGESKNDVLAPFNVDTQDIRTRIWDGHDNFLSENLTYIKGNHLFQFGGQYQRNFDYHQRTDNGGGINYTTTYQIGGGSNGANGFSMTGLQAAGYPDSTSANYTDANRSAAEVLGMVTSSQVAYTRSGANLTLNAPLTPASDKSTIPFYNVYVSDTWKVKPSLTLTYGLGYTLEMPPTEATGKQVVVVDAADEPIGIEDYLNQRKAAALKGEVYNPEVGFSLVHNVGNGYKYPYNPFYGSFSPRIAVAWNPHFDGGAMGAIFGGSGTVIRAGYGRIYGRLNGVDLVLVPLLGVGLIQPVQCNAPLSDGTCGGANSGTDTSGFRIGVDGSSAPLQAAQATLPQPLYPGYNSGATSAAEGLDPHFRPNDVDSFDLTIQRQISRRNTIEVGYIGRLIHHEYQPYNMNAVPYMMTLGGQSFAQAYAALETAFGCATSAAQCGKAGNPTVGAQPFFEAALSGTGYCTGYTNCTTAVVDKEGAGMNPVTGKNATGNLLTQDVWHLWSDMDGGLNNGSDGGFNFPRTMMNTAIPGEANGGGGQASSGIALNASTGYGNYHGGFITFKTSNFHGITAQANFTYSKALGTGAVVQASSEYTPNDPFNLNAMYGVQYYNHKFIFNTFVLYQTPWYKSQTGFVGRLLGGYTISPVFVAGSGAPVYCNTNTDSSSFGEGDGNAYFSNEQCVFTSKYKGGATAHRNVNGGNDAFGNTVGTETEGTGAAAINMFANPAAVFDQVRAPILGIDTKNPGQGPIAGLPYWNMDVNLSKSVRLANRVSIELTFVSTNVLNHLVFANTGLAINSTQTWGVISSQGNTPRQMQFGGRVRF
jgi:hypothetical protein